MRQLRPIGPGSGGQEVRDRRGVSSIEASVISKNCPRLETMEKAALVNSKRVDFGDARRFKRVRVVNGLRETF